MSVLYSFLDHAVSLTWSTNGTPNTVVGYTWTPDKNGNLNGLYFYKFAGDTGAHTAFCWLESNQSLLGSVLFTGETASGWQYMAFPTPIAVTAGTNYRVAISHVTGSWAYDYSGYHFPFTAGTVMHTGNNGWYGNGSQTNYPTSSSGDYYGLDVQFDGPAVTTNANASQLTAEAWASDAAPSRVSQALIESWEASLPAPARTSQLAAETWVQKANVQVSLSQLFTEAWIRTGIFVIPSQLLGELWTDDVAPSRPSQMAAETWVTSTPRVRMSSALAEVWINNAQAPTNVSAAPERIASQVV